jgi:hypothetical protein
MRVATCACGQLKLRCDGDPVRVSICHCFACQRRTGSVFGTQARYARDKVAVAGRVAQWIRVADDGGRIAYRFCPDCGATVYWEIEGLDDVYAIAVGAFADPQFPAPVFSVYEARRHAWAVMPELKAEHHD